MVMEFKVQDNHIKYVDIYIGNKPLYQFKN